MKSNSEPLVSVVTPVYNTEKYLTECIESILGQTYHNWEYTIVDNRSTDRSREIAEFYAGQDDRIRVHTNETFLSQMENWNHALRLMSPESEYCKIVHADDWLFPECIDKMVACGEENPTAGLIGSYRLDEVDVNLGGLPYPSPVTAGRDVARLYLLEHVFVFGAPSSLLIRSDVVRRRDPFYDENNLHADVDACLDILRDSDFGFVHQVLTFTRRHNESTSSRVQRFATRKVARLAALQKHGPAFLEPEELDARSREMEWGYYRFLATQALELREKEFWEFHRTELGEMGCPLEISRLASALVFEMLDLRGSGRRLLSGVRRRLSANSAVGAEDRMGMFRKKRKA